LVKSVYIAFIFWFFTIETLAQVSIQTRFENASDSVLFTKNNPNFPKTAADSLSAANILRGVLKPLHAQSYLEAAFDSIRMSPKSITANLHIGKPYKWANLRNGNVNTDYLSQVGYRERLFDGKPFSSKEITDIEEKLLNFAEDTGFPFAQVWLDSIKIENAAISAALMMKTGTSFRFDTIELTGFAKISPRFLENYLDIKKGSLFNRTKVLKMGARISELPYLTLRQPPTVRFTEGGHAVVNLLLDNRKASRWDFLVGVQPTTQPNGTQKFGITFNGTADFQNLLGAGERIYATFENLRPQSPRFNIKASYPYILNLPYGFDGAFDLYKRDSAYIETRANAGVQYLLGGSDYLKLFWQNYSSNNLIVNKLQIAQTRRLPQTLDVSTNTIGLEFMKQKLDYRFNPRRGWAILLRGGAGIRKVSLNSDILDIKDPTFDFKKLYDTVALRSFQYRLDNKTEFYLPVLKRSVLKMAVTSGWLFTSAPISQNEQYRIGGNKILRGFDEESLFATRYAVGTVEYRLLIGRNSYLYAFGDVGYVENQTRNAQTKDTPLGFGAGITFETNVGLFGVTLAAGRQQGNPIDFRNVKTHFGYVSVF
jgi:outer membrane protein assembly factor BamA